MGSNAGQRSGTGRIGFVAVGAAAILVLAISAVAGAALKTKSATTTVGESPDAGSATAKCKRGSEAVSGGFDNTDFDPEFPIPPGAAVFNFASSREGKRKWTAAGSNSGTDPGELIAYAYCDKREPGLKKKSTTVPVEVGETASATAKCKRGSVAVSGGYGSEDPSPGFNPFSSIRDGKRTWTVEVYGFTLTPSDLTAFVYCDKSEPKVKTKSAEVAVAADEAGTATATCKRKSEAVAGGFDGPDAAPDEPIGAAIYPYESLRTGKRTWTAAGWNDEEDGTFVVYAYCKKK
jgi:hypothetical protein